MHTYDVSENSCIPVLADWLSETKEWQSYNRLLIVKPQIRAHAQHASYIRSILPPTTGVNGHFQGVTIDIALFQT